MNKLFKIILLFVSINFSLYAHDGHMHKAPWEACEEKVKEDSCSYTDGNKDLFRGTCQYFSDKLLCVRNKPIIKDPSKKN